MTSTFVHNVHPAGPGARPAPIDSRSRHGSGAAYAAENALQGALALGQQFADIAHKLAASGSLGIKLTANDLMKLGWPRLLELRANAGGASGGLSTRHALDEFAGYDLNDPHAPVQPGSKLGLNTGDEFTGYSINEVNDLAGAAR